MCGPGSVRVTEDAELARTLALETGELLVGLRDGAAPGRQLEYRGDRLAHEFLVGELARRRPDDAVRSEEGADDPVARRDAERLWIVDPLDGSSGFGRGGGEWGVHVALVVGGRLAAGAVCLPDLGVLLDSATVPAVPDVPVDPARPLRVTVSRGRPPPELAVLVDELGARPVPLASAGVKAAAVVQGDVDAYVHSGGQYEWDNAAPAAVAVAAGVRVTRVDGRELRFARPDPYSPDLLVARPAVHELLLATLRGPGSRGPAGRRSGEG